MSSSNVHQGHIYAGSHLQNDMPAQPAPKQRKLNRTMPQLKRNAACLPCRRRRIKCDAGKPHCSSCIRSFQFLARTQPDEERDGKGVQCFYDEDADDTDDAGHSHGAKEDGHSASDTSPGEAPRGVKRKGEGDDDPREVIKRLEDKVAQLQHALATTSVVPDQSNLYSSTAHTYSIDVLNTAYDPNTAVSGMPTAPMNSVDLTLPPLDLPSAPTVTAPGTATQAATVTDDIDGEAGKMGGIFMDLLWPSWPPKLPTPAMLDHLLALPPTHPDFPHPALLHAICAVSARFTAAVKNRSVPDSIEKMNQDARRAAGKGLPNDDPSEETCFSERNAKYALEAFKFEHVSPRGLLDILQAQVSVANTGAVLMCQIIMGHWGQANARWIEGWILIGASARLAICLGLLDHQPDDFGTPALRQSILPPAKNDIEREERRAAAYFVVNYDITSSASSGWPNTLPTEEMGPMPENPQYYHSADLFSNLTFPPSLRDPVQYMHGYAKGVDADLIVGTNMKGRVADLQAAHLVPRVASIFLHEPFADLGDPSCSSSARILAEARACLSIVYLVVSSNSDISWMVAPITSCDYFFTAARTLLLFFQRALENGDKDAAHSYKSEITVFKMAFAALAHRFAMGARHLTMIEIMVQHVEEEVLGHAMFESDSDLVPRARQPPAWQVAHPHLRRPADASGDPDWVTSPLDMNQGREQEKDSADEFAFPHTHPDGMMHHTLLRQRSVSRVGKDVSVHELLDQRRGFVGSPKSGPSSAASNGNSPHASTVHANGIVPLGWMQLNLQSYPAPQMNWATQSATGPPGPPVPPDSATLHRTL
ncbi:hypothetical protein IAU60_005765 [Kwoniella sp. DSM 27419]